MAIVLGIPFLLLSMGLVMGVPFFYYLKHDQQYENTKIQPDNVRLQVWYNS